MEAIVEAKAINDMGVIENDLLNTFKNYGRTIMTQEEYKNMGLPTDEEIEQHCKPNMTPIEAAEWMRDKAAIAASDTRYNILLAVAKAKISADKMFCLAGYDTGDFYNFIMDLADELHDMAEI